MNKPSKPPTVEDALNELDAASTLHGAMALAFAEIEAATKSATNPHFKSKYADLTSVIAAIKPPLIKHGLFFTQRCQPSDGGVMVQTMLYHRNGDSMSLGELFVPANKQDAQGFGSALTYARRYALQTAFGVPTEDDDGNAAVATARPSEGVSRPANGDAPVPLGPAKNKTELKAMGRDFWREVESSADPDEFECLLADKTNRLLVKQMIEALPSWWEGGDRNGEPFEGLEAVIARRRKEFEQENVG